MRLRLALRIQRFKCFQIQLGTCGQWQAIKLYVLLKFWVECLSKLVVAMDFPQGANHKDCTAPASAPKCRG